MSQLPVISIIGRPNVGKSSLFNRIIRKRIAVVDDFPGVTRDRNYYSASWCGRDFVLVDTGGLVPNLHEELPEAIHEQVRIALSESAAIVFMVEAHTGATDLDLLVAQQLRRLASDKVILVVNKAESKDIMFEIDSYRTLGLGDPMPISALHGDGIADMLDRMLAVADKKPFHANPGLPSADALKITIVGRPNAGKSSLVNRLLNKNRMIVSEVPGTTRDAIDSLLKYQDRELVIIDTAGLRKKSHVKKDMEYYSNLRAIQSIERCDIAILLIDVTEGVGIQDLRILRKINELRKGVVVVWNKWDIMEKDHKTFDELAKEARYQFAELKPLPMCSISALTGQRAQVVIKEVLKVHERMLQRISAAEFEDYMFELIRHHPHPVVPHKQVRFLGAKQAQVPYPLFRFFVSNPSSIVPSYVRYLTKKIHEKYDFEGCPVTLEFRSVSGTNSHSNSNATHADHVETA